MSNFDVIEKIAFTDPKYKNYVSSNTYLVVTINGVNALQITDSPFGNCQIWSIAHFNYAFQTADWENAIPKIQELKRLCGIRKSLCQLDIEYGLYSKIKEYLNPIATMEYTNLTGSSMIQLLIKTK